MELEELEDLEELEELEEGEKAEVTAEEIVKHCDAVNFRRLSSNKKLNLTRKIQNYRNSLLPRGHNTNFSNLVKRGHSTTNLKIKNNSIETH
jgi:hypothetical protein